VAEQVPCGAAAKKAIAAAGVSFTPVTLEQDVKAAFVQSEAGRGGRGSCLPHRRQGRHG